MISLPVALLLTRRLKLQKSKAENGHSKTAKKAVLIGKHCMVKAAVTKHDIKNQKGTNKSPFLIFESYKSLFNLHFYGLFIRYLGSRNTQFQDSVMILCFNIFFRYTFRHSKASLK